MNKKGAEKILAVYWFAVLILIAGGIFAMVYVFYQGSYDVREVEANILINKISDCLSEGGYLREEVFDVTNETFLLDKSNFLEVCHLNFNVEEKWEDEEQYYIEINVYKFGDVKNPVLNIFEGNKNWIGFCELQDDKEYEKLVKCVRKRFYSLDKDLDEEENQYLIEILSIIRKTEKNVK